MSNLHKIWKSSDAQLETIEHISLAIKDVYDTFYPLGSNRTSIASFLNILINQISNGGYDSFNEFIGNMNMKDLRLFHGHISTAIAVVALEHLPVKHEDVTRLNVLASLRLFSSYFESKYEEQRQMSNDTA